MAIRHQLLFTNLLLLSGKLSKESYQAWIATQKELAESGVHGQPVDEYLLEMGLVSESFLDAIREIQIGPERKSIGDIAVDQQLCWSQHVDDCLIQQRKARKAGAPRLLGDILKKTCNLSDEDMLRLLKIQGESHGLGDTQTAQAMVRRAAEVKAFPWTEKTQVGSYLLDARQGDDALGLLFDARDLQTHQKVQLRIFAGVAAPRQKDVIAQLMLLQKLNHPKMSRCFPVEKAEDGTAVLPTVPAEGCTLNEELLKQGKLTIANALKIVVQMIEVLQAAKQVNLTHGNLRLDNVHLANDELATISEFGLFHDFRYQAFDCLNGQNCHVAPERVFGAQFDHRSDIFSLGTILYQLVTGVPLLPGKSIFDGHLRLAVKAIPAFEGWLEPGAHEVHAVIVRMTHPQANRRYPNYETLLKDLMKVSEVAQQGVDLTESSKQKYYDISREMEEIKEKKQREEKLIPQNKFQYFYLYKAAVFMVVVGLLFGGGLLFSKNFRWLLGLGREEALSMDAPPGTLLEQMAYYQKIIDTEKNLKRKEEAETRYRQIARQYNFGGMNHLEEIKDQVKELFENKQFNAAIAMLEKFDRKTYSTEEWNRTFDQYGRELRDAVSKRVEGMSAGASKLVNAKKFDEAVKALAAYRNSDYEPCLREAQRLTEWVETKRREEQERIAREIELRRAESEKALLKVYASADASLRKFNFANALTLMRDAAARKDDFIPDHQQALQKRIGEVKEAWSAFSRLVNNSYVLGRRTPIEVRYMDRPYTLLRGVKEGKWLLQPETAKRREDVMWSSMPEEENFRIVSNLARATGFPYDIKAMTRYFLILGDRERAGELYAGLQALGETDTGLHAAINAPE